MLMRIVGFEVLTAVVIKSTLFWDIMSCSLLKVNRYCGGTYDFHLQGQRISHAETSMKADGKVSHVG
jgi:hypothetical protein